jgi:2-C-methyl-D-erythritol 4-phosphate cytidylyltransferase
MNCTAIILAAGSGVRFGADQPKQYLQILGKSLLEHSLSAFESTVSVNSVIVVAAPELTGSVAENIFSAAEYSKVCDVIGGGASRAESTRNALGVLEDSVDLVAIHDAARPTIHSEDIERVIAQAKESGAALLVSPVTDTIKRVTNSQVKETVDRSDLFRAETPQVFARETIISAHENAVNESTDDSQAVEADGKTVSIVEALHPNIKVTTQADLTLAEAILRARAGE